MRDDILFITALPFTVWTEHLLESLQTCYEQTMGELEENFTSL